MRYRAKTNFLQAVQIKSDNFKEIAHFCGDKLNNATMGKSVELNTVHGIVTVHIGDFIVRENDYISQEGDDEFYSVSKHVFLEYFEEDTAEKSYLGKLIDSYNEHVSNLTDIRSFMASDEFKSLSKEEQYIVKYQKICMIKIIKSFSKRISLQKKQ
ncbi:MAG: hypothetical protein ACRCZB_05505 [Bacteroidales bacterium]